MAGLRGRGRIRSGAMSVDKAELCVSLFTWVGRGWGQGQVSACSCRRGPGLGSAHLSSWGGEEEGGRWLAGPLDSGPSTRPCHVEGLRGQDR